MNSSEMFHFQVLGSASLRRGDGSPLTGRATQRHRLALLSLLAMAAGQRLSRDKLVGYLWPEADPEAARNLLNVSTYVLRTALGESALQSVGDELQLHAEIVHADAAEFDAAFARADYERAVTLYRGPFLDGFFLPQAAEFEHWVRRERERIAGAYAKSLEALAETAESEHEFLKAAEWWKARAAHDLYDSRVALRLIQALDAGGNRALALQHAAAHQGLLREEFGIAPSAEMQALTERLRKPTHQEVAVPDKTLGRAVEQDVVRPHSTNEKSDARVAVEPDSPLLSSSTAIMGERRGIGFGVKWLTAAALLAAVAVMGAGWFVRSHESAPERSVVVLPFRNVGADRDNDYLSDGISEEISTSLSAMSSLKVISRASATRYEGSEKPVRQIADELKVAHVLQGRVQRSGQRVRISVQLVKAGTGENVWAKDYDDDIRDIFRLQDQIARDVAQSLDVDMGGNTQRKPGRQGTRDPEAYRLYRWGRFHWYKRTKEGHEQAMEYFRRAIERDSTYSDAYAGMADVYLTAYQFNQATISEAETYARMKWAAERALQLDDQSAEAHVSFAMVLWWQRDWPGAERELHRALELNPGHPANGWHAQLLSGLGRTDESVEEMRRAQENDPFSVLTIITYAWQCRLVRDYDCAIEQYLRAVEINPAFVNTYQGLSLSYAQKGMSAEAIRAGMKAVELAPSNTNSLADLAYAQARGGETKEARKNLERAKRHPLEGFNIARAYVALNEADSAFAWLDRSSWQWPHRAVRVDPALDPLRSDPRFAQLVSRVDREMGIR